ncbi:cytochrome c oxidase assembly protein [Castellaniella sp.]|uniref:cytochrome c oxidase assembly protein n=1 Tax=Castellaniella sp. TaxID=1955812 RepID=UPI002AFF6F03|nr:cytochrome c oxidase assembly protein [Castellaniella sp.]
MDLLAWLQPWEFSPTLVLVFLASAWLFLRGLRVHRVGRVRQTLFWIGLALLYLSLHTRVDYYAERMFFIHRLQHLVLHHLGPLLIMGAYPGQVMRAGLPLRWRTRLAAARLRSPVRQLEALATHRILIPFLFVLLVLIWLEPTVQFYSMLDWRIYRFMNWSVVISGLLYWNLILDRRPHPPAALTAGGRIFSPVFTMVPQMVAGAVIAFTGYDLYPIFDLCGRALPGFSALDDQVIGGLIMWVPAGLIETFGLLYALGTLMRLSSRGRLPPPKRRVPRPSARAAS